MAQLESGQESTNLASQVERDLSRLDASQVNFNVDDMFKSEGEEPDGEEQEGEEQDGGNEKTENLDENYLDSKFKALYNDISQSQVKNLLEVHNSDGINYEISLDACSVKYNAQEHSCNVTFYNYGRSQPIRGPRLVTAKFDVTDKETFDYIESNIRESIKSKDFIKLENNLSSITLKQSVENLNNKNKVLGNTANNALDGLLKK